MPHTPTLHINLPRQHITMPALHERSPKYQPKLACVCLPIGCVHVCDVLVLKCTRGVAGWTAAAVLCPPSELVFSNKFVRFQQAHLRTAGRMNVRPDPESSSSDKSFLGSSESVGVVTRVPWLFRARNSRLRHSKEISITHRPHFFLLLPRASPKSYCSSLG